MEVKETENKNKEAVAELKFFRISPKKIRPILKELKGKKALFALSCVDFLPQRAAFFIKKILKSVVANAENKGLDREKLIIKEFICNEGPRLKRWRPQARGRINTFSRKLSHLKVVVEEKESIGGDKKIKDNSKTIKTKKIVKNKE